MEYTRKKDIEYLSLKLITKAGAQELIKSMVKIVIYEDMFANALTCEVVIHDAENLPEMNPIIGDEYLDLQFRSAVPDSDKDYPIVKLYMKLKSIDNKIIDDGSVKQYYTLTFMSSATEMNLKRRLNRAYDDKESGIASNILEKVLKVPKMDVETTKWNKKIVIPNWQPFQALDYLAKSAVRASGYPASNFLFWEDRDTHYFKSLDKIMEEGAQITLTNEITGNSEWDDKPNHKLYNISAMQAVNAFNDMTNTMNGLWSKEFIGQDIIKKKLTHHKWKYSAEWSGSVQIDGGNEQLRTDYPSEDYLQQDFEPWQEGDGDYNSWKSDDSVKRRISMMQQFDNYQYVCHLPGDTNIRMGIVAKFKLPSHTHRAKASEEDEVLKGNWLITRIKHELNQRTHEMQIEIRKPHLKSLGPVKVVKDEAE